MSKKDFTPDITAGFAAFLPQATAAESGKSETPAPMKEQGAEIPEGEAGTQSQERTQGNGRAVSDVIKGLERVPRRERNTRRVSLVIPQSVDEEMRATCEEYGLSLNAGALLAFKLFLETMKAKDEAAND